MQQSSQFWKAPARNSSSYLTGLKMQNTLTQNLTEFVPISGRKVTWYMCGPTVYDSSHLGHARTYMNFDTIKKIMRDYFHYDIELCMNITDIDDKIINRSNERGMDFMDFKNIQEESFMEDMKNLNVEIPEILTRVTEYVPEIIQFIQKIIDNGFAYESNGSVYFAVDAYQKDGRFLYGILEPGNCQNQELLQEAEGALSQFTGDKRNQTDFALWKKSKEGEPYWESTWGPGRPGWHIECSAMAAAVFDFPVDMHSGGVDLRFPHHTNELAQSEAYYNKPQWINYFIHTGHLHIDGLKMSKSLKNFITIKEMLKTYTANQLRLIFILHKYDQLMCFSQGQLEEAKEKERRFNEFLLAIQAIIRTCPIKNAQKWTESEFALRKIFEETKVTIHQAFSNNFNTEGAIEAIEALMKETYKYIKQERVVTTLLQNIHDYIQFIFKCLGLTYGQKQESDLLIPVVNCMVDFRDQIRDCAKDKDFRKVMEVCDNLRDQEMIQYGIKIEDRDKQKSIWKFSDKEKLLKELEDKKAAILAKEQEKQRKAEEERLQAQIDPKTMFEGKYGSYDESGVPLTDLEGKELNKKLIAKLKKDQEKQKKLFEKYQA